MQVAKMASPSRNLTAKTFLSATVTNLVASIDVLLLSLMSLKRYGFVLEGPTSEGQILDGKKGEDIDFQKSRTFLTAHWNEFEDLESDVISLSWCAGLSPGSCNLVQKSELTPSSTSTRKVLNEPIKNGERYYVTVNAVNGAGVQTTYTSDGVTVDETPPTSGIVIHGDGRDSKYVNGEQDIHAQWINFEDLESDIDSYEIALCDARNVSFCPQSFTGVGKATNVSITGKLKRYTYSYIYVCLGEPRWTNFTAI